MIAEPWFLKYEAASQQRKTTSAPPAPIHPKVHHLMKVAPRPIPFRETVPRRLLRDALDAVKCLVTW